MSDGQLRVAFLHPDLGIGGAERLVVDAAVELVAHGHHVDIFTPYYDPARCFEETLSGAFRVFVSGGWFPASLLGRMVALCAYIRCMLAALHIAFSCWMGTRPAYDVIIVDQVGLLCHHPSVRLRILQ